MRLFNIFKKYDWIELKECPACKSDKIKWYLSSTKECPACKMVFRSHVLKPIKDDTETHGI